MYVRLDKIKSSAHLESIIADVDLVNGQFVALGALEADGEARKVTPSGDVAKKLVFHASVPLTYLERQTELDFVLEKGRVGRGFVLEEGDIISIEKKGVSGAMAKGAIVVPDANGFKVGTPAGLHGEIIAIENDMYAGELAVIRISTK
ncbi:hypothetical protein [Bacillus cereus]|uniref:hypothetical protein n=1 Tax=Bacillus cereus TaxID=1396 RepID=UPI000BFB2295|nr:hypothetical protein [Bacillus cereus]PGU82151.1 hypothetical protein COD76_11700 [Bacillus cereus]